MKYQFNFKAIYDGTKEFFVSYIWKKAVGVSLLASIVFSIFIVLSSTPQFLVSATLIENSEESSKQNISGFIQSLEKSSNKYDKFRANVYSSATARALWDSGWGSKIFGSGELTEENQKIFKSHGIFKKFSSFLLGYELSPYYSHYDLNTFIIQSVTTFRRKGAEDITISMFTADNQDYSKDFINALILTADNNAKSRDLIVSEARIKSITKQLRNTKNAIISTSLSTVLNSEYFKVATLSNDLPYYVYFVDPPHVSESPVSPNVLAIFIANLFIFFIFSIFRLFFIHNKDDLW